MGLQSLVYFQIVFSGKHLPTGIAGESYSHVNFTMSYQISKVIVGLVTIRALVTGYSHTVTRG